MLRNLAWRTAAISLTIATLTVTLSGTASANPNGGVSASTIQVGVPYIDFSSLKAIGINLDHGNYPDAYNAVIADLNRRGGIDGRKLVPIFAGVNPTGTAASLAVCTQMTEDHQIFVAMAPYMPDCYLQQHKTPTINADATGVYSTPNFTLDPPAAAYDPLQLSVFSKMNLFKNKKVGVFAGSATDGPELQVVQSVLKKLHVHVVQTATVSAPATDQTAQNQEVAVIAQRFQNAGVNEVVAVGTGSSTWPSGLRANQSTYNPTWIATAATDLSGYIAGSGFDPTYVQKVVTSQPVPTSEQMWADPSMQKCIKVIRSAYPSDTITAPNPTSNSSDHSYLAAMNACQNVAIFAKIAATAGKKLTVANFTKAGYSLRNVTFPGSNGPVSFGPGRSYAIGPVFVGTYDASERDLKYSSKSATG